MSDLFDVEIEPRTVPETVNMLPVFDGDLSGWLYDVSVLQTALEEGQLDYIAQLPQVVGWVPGEERARFDNLDLENNAKPRFKPGCFFMDETSPQTQFIEDALPGTLEIIRNDLEIVSGGFRELDTVHVTKEDGRKEGSEQSPEYPNEFLHTDIVVDEALKADEPFYLVVNDGMTGYYNGPSRIAISNKLGYTGMLALEPEALDAARAANLSTPSPYAVVRMSYASVHIKPVNLQSGRTALKAHVTQF